MPPEPPTHTLAPTAESVRKLVLTAIATICQVLPPSVELWTAPVGEMVHCGAGTLPAAMPPVGAPFQLPCLRAFFSAFPAVAALAGILPSKEAAGDSATTACPETSTVSISLAGVSFSWREGDRLAATVTSFNSV